MSSIKARPFAGGMAGQPPKRIICMTEESVEFLYGIGREDLIVGVSHYAVRPPQAKSLPTISAFTHANIKKILSLKPDLVVGFSDIQKDIAKELIGHGVNVYISNQRSLQEIFDYLLTFGSMIGEVVKTKEYLQTLSAKVVEAMNRAVVRKRKPLVYIEEWDDPLISGISWFSELVELCGGIDIFKERSRSGALAKDRFLTNEEVVQANPDIILACWCGKKVEMESFHKREGFPEINAIKEGHLYELPPEIFLQPGPAPFLEGLEQLNRLFDAWESAHRG